MEVIVGGCAKRRFHASQAASMMSSRRRANWRADPARRFRPGSVPGRGRAGRSGRSMRARRACRWYESGAVEQQDLVGILGYRLGDLAEMGLHGVRVGKGHGQHRADAPYRADRSEEVGAIVALVGGLARPRCAPGPLPTRPFFSRCGPRPGTRARFTCAWGHGRDGPSASPRRSFERLDHALVLGRMVRPRADVGEADLL